MFKCRICRNTLEGNAGLKWKFDEVTASPNGDKSIYTSQYNPLKKLGFTPRFTSLESLMIETEKYLKIHGNCK